MTEHIVTQIKELRAEMNNGFEKVTDKLHENNITLAIQTEQLKEHMRRSDMLERGQDKIEDEITPLKEHVAFVSSGLKWAGLISAFLAFVLGVKQLFF